MSVDLGAREPSTLGVTETLSVLMASRKGGPELRRLFWRLSTNAPAPGCTSSCPGSGATGKIQVSVKSKLFRLYYGEFYGQTSHTVLLAAYSPSRSIPSLFPSHHPSREQGTQQAPSPSQMSWHSSALRAEQCLKLPLCCNTAQ